METLDQLKAAMDSRKMVRFTTQYEDVGVRGYVLDIGEDFFLLAVVSDRLWLDGFECFRVGDIATFGEDPYSDFAESALEKRGQDCPERPDVDVSSVKEIIASADRDFPLITIHREELDSEVCNVGKIISIDDDHFYIREINPGAKWSMDLTEYELDDITRIGFGQDYEDALYLVGGEFEES